MKEQPSVLPDFIPVTAACQSSVSRNLQEILMNRPFSPDLSPVDQILGICNCRSIFSPSEPEGSLGKGYGPGVCNFGSVSPQQRFKMTLKAVYGLALFKNKVVVASSRPLRGNRPQKRGASVCLGFFSMLCLLPCPYSGQFSFSATVYACFHLKFSLSLQIFFGSIFVSFSPILCLYHHYFKSFSYSNYLIYYVVFIIIYKCIYIYIHTYV